MNNNQDNDCGYSAEYERIHRLDNAAMPPRCNARDAARELVGASVLLLTVCTILTAPALAYGVLDGLARLAYSYPP